MTTALWPALAVAVAGLALAQPAQANLALTVSDSGGVIAACNATDGGTGTFSKGCANPNFSQIIVTAVGAPLLPAPGLFATQISLTSGNARSADTLTIDVAQTGLSLAAGTVAVNLTVGGMGPSPVTLTALGPGGGVLLSQTFTTPGHVTSDAIPIAAGSGDNARFVLQFSGPNQTVNALISLTGQSTAGLSDAQQPGSVLVFPKFVGGDPGVANSQPPVTVDGIPGIARTEIEIGAVCPPLADFVEGTVSCTPHQTVTVHGHWVCPGFQGVNSQICREEDFTFTLTTNGKVAFSADGNPINSNTPSGIPAPPCPRGYLIAWVVNPTTLLPIKFDALIGTAIIRGPDLAGGPHAGSSTAVSAYPAITIQVAPSDAALGSILTGPPLQFDGASGHYAAVTGTLVSDVTFDRLSAGTTGPAPAVLSETYINLLTLDVLSNRPNNSTQVPLNFYNESANTGGIFGGGEHQISTSTSFVCWQQVGLTTTVMTFLGDGRPGQVTPPINSVLNQITQTTRKGIVIAGPATKIPEVDSDPVTGVVSLIGLIETNEGTMANMFQERKFNYLMGTDGNPQAGTFSP